MKKLPAGNPWQNISWEQTIAECDKEVVATFNNNKRRKIKICDKLLPEPFSGNPESNVLCLNLNPGVSDGDFCFIGNQTLLDMTRRTLRGETEYSMWLDENSPYPGRKWWTDRTAQLKCAIGGQPKMFVLEYFPYHTKKSVNFPNLPSDFYRNILLDNAIDEGKLVIIMRGKKWWYDIDAIVHDKDGREITLGEKLRNYDNILEFNSVQNVCFTKNNIKDPQKDKHENELNREKYWQKLIAALK